MRGPTRSAKEWRKVYANMKALTKRKTATIRSQRAETGGGEIDPDSFLTEEDEIIQRIAGPSCDGIPLQEEPGSMDSFDPNRAIVIFPRSELSQEVSLPPEEHRIAADHEDALVANYNQIETSQSTIEQQEVLSFVQSGILENNIESFVSDAPQQETEMAQGEPQIANQNRGRGTSAVGLDSNNSQPSQPNRIPRLAARVFYLTIWSRISRG